MGIEKNTVSAKAQIQDDGVRVFRNNGKYKVLFIGNSITRHGPNKDIGWENDWGMAASAKEKDYVHIAVRLLEEKLGAIDYCISHCSDWERLYYQDENIEKCAAARDFDADIVVVRLGENLFSAKDHFETDDIAPHYAKLVEYLSPNAKVVITTDLFWPSEIIDKAIHTIADEKGYALVSLGDLGLDEKYSAAGKFWHSGVAHHPGDLGMQKIAERIVDKIFEKLL